MKLSHYVCVINIAVSAIVFYCRWALTTILFDPVQELEQKIGGCMGVCFMVGLDVCFTVYITLRTAHVYLLI